MIIAEKNIKLASLVFCLFYIPPAYAHTSISDEDFQKILMVFFVWLAVPIVSALMAKKGRYFKTLSNLFAAWLLHLFGTALFFIFFDIDAFGKINWYVFWVVSASLLALAVLIFRLEARTTTAAAKQKVRPIQIALCCLTIVGVYILIAIIPLPPANVFWTEVPSTWNDFLNKRHRVAMYLIGFRQLTRKPASHTIGILGKPLIPMGTLDVETTAIHDQVSGYWERDDANALAEHEERKKTLPAQDLAESKKVLLYRLSVGKRKPSSTDPISYSADPANDSVIIEWLRVNVDDNRMVTHAYIESQELRVGRVARHLLK
jgi:hypothetical protein